MARRRNAITEAYEQIEDEDQISGLSEDEIEAEAEGAADEFTSEADAGEFTDEEVIEEVERASADARRAMDRSRQRGQVPSRAQHERRETASRRDAKARNPARSRDPVESWQPANTLEAPPARPGMEQRWIRFQLGDKNDPRNWARKLKERWTPRRLDTVEDHLAPPTLRHQTVGEVIGVGDLILCERPAEIGAARRRFFRQKTQRQMAAAEHRHVDKVQRRGHKIAVTSQRDRPSVGRGQRQTQVQDD